MSDVIADLKKEVIKLIHIVYLHPCGLDDKVLSKVYKYLEHMALTNCDGGVQLESLEFWTSVVKKHLSNQGINYMKTEIFPIVSDGNFRVVGQEVSFCNILQTDYMHDKCRGAETNL